MLNYPTYKVGFFIEFNMSNMQPIQVQYSEKENKIYAPITGKWLEATPEEKIRQSYVVTLVNEMGYSLEQMKQEETLTNSSRGTGRARADIVIWKTKEDKRDNKLASIVVECKSDNVIIQPEDYYQGLNYATWAGADFFVTHNTKETRYFQVYKEKLPKHLGKELSRLPTAQELLSDDATKQLVQEEKTFKKDEFANLLHQCHNIIRNNDKLSPEAAFDEISKILFMKIMYERTKNQDIRFSKEEFLRQEEYYEQNQRQNNINMFGEKANIPYMDYWFETTKGAFRKDALFSDADTIKIRRESFLAIVKNLEIYNLSKTSDDVKGIAFEKFLGTTFRGELGQFFTPRTIVEFMTEVLDPQEGERVCDPCSGSGGFLIHAFEYMRENIRNDIETQKERIKKQFFDEAYENANDSQKQAIENQVDKIFIELNKELDSDNTDSRIHHLSHACIYGTDANPRMARVSKMNMIMHGDGHGGVHHNDGLLNINGIYEGRFDVILTNPPFGSRVDKDLAISSEDSLKHKPHYTDWVQKYDNYEAIANEREQDIENGTKILDKFTTGSMSALTEVLFMERCLNLLRAGGRMGIVLPEGVLNTSNLQKVREYFEGRAKIILITSIPQDVFMASGATVKPSLVFLKRFTLEEEAQYQVITEQSKQTITARYQNRIDEINALLKKRGKEAVAKEEKASLKIELKSIEENIANEVRQLVKERFNYQIPLAEIENAGIDSKGAVIANDLVDLQKEFTAYRKQAGVWENAQALRFDYVVDGDNVVRQAVVGQSAVTSEVL